MQDNKILVILGMHRSGTSLITRWLQSCGLQVGDNLLGPETGNEEGHFEDLDFVRRHENLLLAKKLPHTGLVDKTAGTLSLAQENEIKALIENKNKHYRQWGWKDPRTCLFLDTYRKLLPHVTYLVILRDYESVVSSLLHRDFKGLNRYYQSKGNIYRFFLRMKRKYHKNWLYKTYAEKYLDVWIAYNEELLNHAHSVPQNIIIADYKQLLKDDYSFFQQLMQYGFDLRYKSFASVFNEQLINKPASLTPYVKNTRLLAYAAKLENALQALLAKQQTGH
ncbi:MAG TPA: sulfotransferase [Chitinophagaceae bacterium]|nr:sulfotransferase [Chitinophagaceae bacterium]